MHVGPPKPASSCGSGICTAAIPSWACCSKWRSPGGLAAGGDRAFAELAVADERADVRGATDGLVAYDDGPRSIPVDPRLTGRAALLDEFYACVLDGRPAVHDGAFARGPLAACPALLRLARSRAEVLV